MKIFDDGRKEKADAVKWTNDLDENVSKRYSNRFKLVLTPQ